MYPKNSIAASSQRVVTIALIEAATRGHRDLDVQEMVAKAFDKVTTKRMLVPGKPLTTRSYVSTEAERGAAFRYIGMLVNVIHQRELRDISRIVGLCITMEISSQLKTTGNLQASRIIRTMIQATA